MKLNFEELPQATAFLLEKVEELTISINQYFGKFLPKN